MKDKRSESRRGREVQVWKEEQINNERKREARKSAENNCMELSPS
jgi:hypothetical protein